MADKEKIVKNILEEVIENERILCPEVRIKQISTSGANYSSVLYAITIRSPGKEDLELFAKVACIGERMREEAPVDETYRLERFVYRDLAKIYNGLQKQYKVPEEEMFLFPKFYASYDKCLEETVILENLAAKGYTLYDRFSSVTWEYATAAVGELAKFHALSYAFAENYPEEFDKTVRDTANLFTVGELHMLQFLKKSETTALEVVPEESRAKLKAFYDRECTIEKFMRNYTSAGQPVFVHGDYRPSNLMHKMMNGKLKKLIPVDYQTLHCGSPVADLVYFIFSSTDGEFRRQYYKQLVDHYYCTFFDFLKKLDLNPEKLYPVKGFYEDLKKGLPFGLFFAAFLLPVVLVEEENAPVMDSETSISTFIPKPNAMFKKRFCEIFDDFVQWGII